MLYYTMLEMVQGHWTQAAQQGVATLKAAGAIAIGLAGASSLEALARAAHKEDNESDQHDAAVH